MFTTAAAASRYPCVWTSTPLSRARVAGSHATYTMRDGSCAANDLTSSSAPSRDRQSEITQPAEEVGDSLARLRIQKRQRPAHQQPVHRVVDLGEIGRTEGDPKPVFGQRVVQIRRIGRPEGPGGIRPTRLQP